MKIKPYHVVILVSADGEWRAIRELFPDQAYRSSPYGEFFTTTLDAPTLSHIGTGLDGDVTGYRLVFFHGGWGKIAAAASAEYAIGRWKPPLLVNLGTCGGFEGEIQRGEIVLVEKTIVYDIIEQMGDVDSHIAHYTTEINLSWLHEPFPSPARRSLLVSGDRDLLVEEIPILRKRYGAVAGDWESGAIAWVAARHGIRTLILRGITDLVGIAGGEAYGNPDFFWEAAAVIMRQLVGTLLGWIAAASQ